MANNGDVIQFPAVKHFLYQRGFFLSKSTGGFLMVEANQVKTAPQNDNDADLLFDVHRYIVPEGQESIAILPIHVGTGNFLSMNLDKKLQLKHANDVDSNGIDNDYTKIDVADDRFFYFKTSAVGESYDILEGMNGKLSDYGYLLSVQPGEAATLLKPSNPSQPPISTLFDFIPEQDMSN